LTDGEPTEPEHPARSDGGGLALDYTPEGTTTALLVVVGPRGGGKTTLMSNLVPLLAPPERTVVTSPVKAIGKRLGLPVEQRYGSDPTNEEYFSKLMDGHHRFVVIDEFDEFCPASVQSKFGGYCCDALYRMVNYGRNEPWCIGMLVSFRGASDVTSNLLRAANVLFVARTQEPNALDYFSRYLGREYGPMLRNLPDYTFVVWAEGRLFGYVRVVEGDLQWVDPPKGWPMPANAPSAGGFTEPIISSETPIESAEQETASATPASDS
jgi:energy-coupling factor transporter ATP-binding protein EcfA2